MGDYIKKINNRIAEYDINDIFLKRWSPRAMSGKSIKKQELMTLFEAARWAPSSYNNQPWRFIYSLKNDIYWQKFLSFLGDFNKIWCKNAGALVVVVSANNFDYNGKPSQTHSFDAGAAWENLALQATFMDLTAHGMQGFDYEKAQKELGIPDDYSVEMMVAIGKPGKRKDLPKELQEKELPGDRKQIGEIVYEGLFSTQPKI